jgi:hypothetical protein
VLEFAQPLIDVLKQVVINHRQKFNLDKFGLDRWMQLRTRVGSLRGGAISCGDSRYGPGPSSSAPST